MLISTDQAQAVRATVNAAASGDSPIGHTVSAAMLGGGLSGIIVWLLQLAHLDPPAAVAQGITACCMVAASWIMQKVSQ